MADKKKPDYSDRPTLVIGYASGDQAVYGVEAEGFLIPEGVRVVARDFSLGSEEDEEGTLYEDEILASGDENSRFRSAEAKTACASDTGTLAPCPYCTNLVEFPAEEDPAEAGCGMCGRDLKLSWSETRITVNVIKKG
jgi:hypothetical protein